MYSLIHAYSPSNGCYVPQMKEKLKKAQKGRGGGGGVREEWMRIEEKEVSVGIFHHNPVTVE